jgi:hypothetical protein
VGKLVFSVKGEVAFAENSPATVILKSLERMVVVLV